MMYSTVDDVLLREDLHPELKINREVLQREDLHWQFHCVEAPFSVLPNTVPPPHHLCNLTTNARP